MSDTPDCDVVYVAHFSIADWAATLAAWFVAGAIFLTVGWIAMEPDDPLGAVSVFTPGGGLFMMIQAAALGGVAAALATVIAGRRLTDVGVIAMALGLAVVSLRGATTEYLLVGGAEVSASFERLLAWKFVFEAIGWFAAVCSAILVSSGVERWCFGLADSRDAIRPGDHPDLLGMMAGYDIPGLSSSWFGVQSDRQTPSADGVKHMLIATGVGLAAMAVLSVGLSSRSIQHGQSCFVVAASISLGTYSACRIVPVRSGLWAILAVGLVSVVGYAWAGVCPATAGLPPSIPSSGFLRILPIQFISVGVAAALGTFGYVYLPLVDTKQDRHSVARGSPR